MYDKSTIGVTIRPDRTWGSGACQTIRNSDIGSDFKNILKDWSKDSAIENSLYDYLLPMSKEEVARREKAKIAEREIVKKGISIDKIKEYVREDGANINKDDGRALINAVEEDDLEKTKLVLELGGNPNLKKASDSAISKAKNIDMIKLLVSYGSDITNDVFSNIIHDMEALEFCLRAGLNPNIGNSMPLRKAAKGSWVSPTNLGESYFDAFRMLVKYGASIAKPVDPKNPKLVSNNISSWAAEYSRIDILDYMVELNSVTLADWEAAMTWIAHARKMTDDVRKEVIAYIEKQKEILKQKRS
jgi:hypothetical protein